MPFGTPDMTAQMQKLQASDPDALLFDLFGQDVLFAFQAMKNIGFDVPVIGGNSASTTDWGQVFTNIEEESPAGAILTAWEINVRRPEGLSAGQQQLLDAVLTRTSENQRRAVPVRLRLRRRDAHPLRGRHRGL